MQILKTRWTIPLFSLVLGLAMLAVEWIGGSPGAGVGSLGVMVAFGAILLLGGRSETVRGLRGDGRDERFRQIDVTATAIAGLIVGFRVWDHAVVQRRHHPVEDFLVHRGVKNTSRPRDLAHLRRVARGHSGAPYTWLGAVAGATYLVAVVVLRVRG